MPGWLPMLGARATSLTRTVAVFNLRRYGLAFQANNECFAVSDDREIRPPREEASTYTYQPTKWHVLGSYSELRNTVGDELLHLNPHSQYHYWVDYSWTIGNLSVQDRAFVAAILENEWDFFRFPGLPQNFLIVRSIEEMERTRRMAHVLDSYEDLVALRRRENLFDDPPNTHAVHTTAEWLPVFPIAQGSLARTDQYVAAGF